MGRLPLLCISDQPSLETLLWPRPWHLQVLWKVLLVHRFAGHPLDSFIDLLFLANTSAVVMDERHSGYYLHGRNQMHHSGEQRGWLVLTFDGG